jgi:hypothetical protein
VWSCALTTPGNRLPSIDESEKQAMSTSSPDRTGGPPRYEIRLQGHLHPRWGAWFDGLSLTNESDGSTALRGPVLDQSDLHGVLRKVRDTGLPLISVTRLDPEPRHASRDPSRWPRKDET